MPGLCCKSPQRCFHNTGLNGCENALVGKSCWDTMGTVPGPCHSQLKHCLEDYWLPQGKTVPGTTLPEVPAQAHHKLPYLAFQTAFKSMCTLVTVFLLCPTFSNFFFLTVFLKLFTLNALPRNYIYTPLPPTSPFPEVEYSTMKQLILALGHH